MIWLILSGLALADEEPSILPVLPGESCVAQVPSYLLPEGKYESCLAKAQALTGAIQALDECEAMAVGSITELEGALVTQGAQLNEVLAELEAQKLREDRYKRQRNVATVAVVGIFAGLTTATILVVAP
jgi:hypothetical protein